ncbi:DUF6538 domain-containing protein [Gluconobacter wancherniae]|uniref:DUF6538 domain-containing protein n=1 Tax=Acetobacteraceae TaxID=433 RepID=UPI000A3D1AC9|nr:DUF6538 domain-containing protein [Acetobacter sp. DsW_54]
MPMKLVRIGTTYNLRRWVPLDLRKILKKNEMWHSLETSDVEVAKIRGCAIFGLTSQFFSIVRNTLSKSYLYDETVKIAESYPDNALIKDIIETYEAHIKELKIQYKLAEAEHFMQRMEDYQQYKKVENIINVAKPELDTVLSYMKEHKDFSAYNSIKNMAQQFSQIQGWVKPPEKKKSPIFSIAVDEYLKSHSEKMNDSDVRGFRNTAQRFIEVCGDHDIRDYTGEDSGKFRELMEKMPENYGKSSKDVRTVQELVAYCQKSKLPRISEKTIKNHFARLSAIWRYYLLRELVDRNIFVGWKFDAKAKIKRIRWNDEQLSILMNSSWNSTTISRKTYAYIVGLGSYCGMRLEEICRIRIEDIQEIRGITCILIREHTARKNRPWEEWNPKTEAGERVIPIGQALINAGFLDFVNNIKSYYLFNQLKFSGKDKKRSPQFQQSFSKFKLRHGVPRGVDFHSFRHNVSTKLRNISDSGNGGLREVWIDNFLGHEGQNKSVGNTVYLDEIDVENLKKVADSVLYPEFWNIRNLIS